MSGHGKRGRGGGHGGGGGGHGGWLVTYADLLTLLMVLFLVLWVISQLDLKKFENFKEGLGDFGNPAAEAAASDSTDSTSTSSGTGLEGAGTGTDPIVPMITSTGELTTEGLNQLETSIEEAVTMAGLPDIISVTSEDRGLVISVSSDDVLFAPGQANLSPASANVIGIIAPALAGFNNHILVEGHTDKRPLARAGYDNWDLSVDRAGSVVKLLRDQFGLDPMKLSAAGYGEMHPLDPADTEEAYAMNRRVEIVVLAGTEVATDPRPTRPHRRTRLR
ncbi:MAG: flagellar motor protein MotB [Ilumatobacteraceae bacterium]